MAFGIIFLQKKKFVTFFCNSEKHKKLMESQNLFGT